MIWIMTMMVMAETVPDCVWDNPNTVSSSFIISTAFPILPLRNCREYCQLMYAHSPQKAYYNATARMCQPRAACFPPAYYSYAHNSCWINRKEGVEEDV